MLLSEYLEHSWSLIDHPNKWITQAYCLYGETIRHCSAGALDTGWGNCFYGEKISDVEANLYDDAYRILIKNRPLSYTGKICLESINDASTWEEVRKMWLDAIREAKASEAVEIEIEEAKANTEIFYPVAA